MDHLQRSLGNTFVSYELNRFSLERFNDEYLEKILLDKGSRFIPLWRGMNLFANNKNDKIDKPILLKKSELDNCTGEIESLIMLGSNSEYFYWCASLQDNDPKIPHKFSNLGCFQNIRERGWLDPLHGELLIYAKAMIYWHQCTKYCGKCGNTNISKAGGHILQCTNKKCNYQNFPRTDPAIIVLVTHNKRCLLGRQAKWPKKKYSVIAGFVEPGECIEHCVLREVYEETGINLKTVSYHSSQPWPFPSSIMLGFMAEANNDNINVDGDELEEAHWFSHKDLYNAVKNSKLFLPSKISISYTLIDHWFSSGDYGYLKDII